MSLEDSLLVEDPLVLMAELQGGGHPAEYICANMHRVECRARLGQLAVIAVGEGAAGAGGIHHRVKRQRIEQEARFAEQLNDARLNSVLRRELRLRKGHGHGHGSFQSAFGWYCARIASLSPMRFRTRERGSPPRAWGHCQHGSFLVVGVRFTPTCVGTLMPSMTSMNRSTVHPHVRGDTLTLSQIIAPPPVHPHVRGDTL